MKDYNRRLTNMKSRRQDMDTIKKYFSQDYYKRQFEKYELLKESESIKYTLGSMQEVDEVYTRNTYEEGDRVKNQLEKLDVSVEFKYQGSVTNNTHIKAHSDIDLLTIYKGFVSLEPPQKADNPYKGDPLQDLISLRGKCVDILSSAFPKVEVDNSGSKSISLKGGSLRRKIDVVPSNWYNTLKYVETNIDYYRGIQILDYHNKKRIDNAPFYHNKLLEEKEILSFRNFKRVVRLLKTLKADAEIDIKLSSYDIAALMYHMDNKFYDIGNMYLLLVERIINYFSYLLENDTFRNQLKVPDASRTIFKEGGATKNDLNNITNELKDLYKDILIDLKIIGSDIKRQIHVA